MAEPDATAERWRPPGPATVMRDGKRVRQGDAAFPSEWINHHTAAHMWRRGNRAPDAPQWERDFRDFKTGANRPDFAVIEPLILADWLQFRGPRPFPTVNLLRRRGVPWAECFHKTLDKAKDPAATKAAWAMMPGDAVPYDAYLAFCVRHGLLSNAARLRRLANMPITYQRIVDRARARGKLA